MPLDPSLAAGKDGGRRRGQNDTLSLNTHYQPAQSIASTELKIHPEKNNQKNKEHKKSVFNGVQRSDGKDL